LVIQLNSITDEELPVKRSKMERITKLSMKYAKVSDLNAHQVAGTSAGSGVGWDAGQRATAVRGHSLRR